jgi:hypothetical protein
MSMYPTNLSKKSSETKLPDTFMDQERIRDSVKNELYNSFLVHQAFANKLRTEVHSPSNGHEESHGSLKGITISEATIKMLNHQHKVEADNSSLPRFNEHFKKRGLAEGSMGGSSPLKLLAGGSKSLRPRKSAPESGENAPFKRRT